MNLVSILIAEDDPEDRFLIEESFGSSRLKNDLFFVNDGAEALQFLRHEGAFSDQEKYPRPGMVMLDLNMPKKGGMEVLEAIRADSDLCTIPVIILTTSNAESDMLRSYKTGANSYITKPVDLDGLIHVMTTLKSYWFGVVQLPGQS